MMRNAKLTIFTLLILLIVSMPVLAQSYLPGVSDGSHNHDKNANPSSRSSAEMQNNPAVVRPNNPAMVNPSDPTGANSNIPGSGGMPPSSGASAMTPGVSSNVAPQNGH